LINATKSIISKKIIYQHLKASFTPSEVQSLLKTALASTNYNDDLEALANTIVNRNFGHHLSRYDGLAGKGRAMFDILTG
jgi:ATP sulfurylase